MSAILEDSRHNFRRDNENHYYEGFAVVIIEWTAGFVNLRSALPYRSIYVRLAPPQREGKT
jgi:hypothetical protein